MISSVRLEGINVSQKDMDGTLNITFKEIRNQTSLIYIKIKCHNRIKVKLKAVQFDFCTQSMILHICIHVCFEPTYHMAYLDIVWQLREKCS